MVLCRGRHGRAGGCQSNGGLAQLGEHLPCKQGVESSNLLVSTGFGWKPESDCTLKTEYWNKKDSNQINQIRRDDEIETSEAGGTRKGKAGRIYHFVIKATKQETKNKEAGSA